MSEKFKLVLRNSEWLRGEGAEVSRLEREDDHKRCCVGVCAIQMGVAPAVITGETTVRSLERHLIRNNGLYEDVELLRFIDQFSNRSIMNQIYDANDEPGMSDEDRVDLLRELFLEFNIEVEFLPKE